MNLERLKFRAKATDGIWLYGIPHKTHLGNWMMRDAYGAGRYIDPDTIGQYTGLKDKEGKEIYEGDIITLREYVGEVIWNNNRTSFCIRFSFEAQVGTESLGAWIDSKRGCRILGNIFDNKNLLEQ